MRLSPLLNKLTEIAAAAGDIVLQSYQTTYEVEFKGPNDPVTSADKAANSLICAALSSEFPNWPIVAEESDPETFGDFRSADRIFFVDPIDGTQEFLDRTGEFVVMIGLVHGDRAVAGVIHAPTTGLFWAGEVGQAAFQFMRNDSAKLIVPSQTNQLNACDILVSRARRSVRLLEQLDAISASTVRALGSAGLKGAMVAEGKADAYLATGRAGKRWDACALDALVTAAGGSVSDIDGRPIDYRGASLVNDRGLVASNGALHQVLLGKLADSKATHKTESAGRIPNLKSD
jgi:3'(2'), 5'-bisphosphate nucleotidase